MTITVRDKHGTVLKTLIKSFGPTFFQQGSSTDFLGMKLVGDESIAVSLAKALRTSAQRHPQRSGASPVQ